MTKTAIRCLEYWDDIYFKPITSIAESSQNSKNNSCIRTIVNNIYPILSFIQIVSSCFKCNMNILQIMTENDEFYDNFAEIFQSNLDRLSIEKALLYTEHLWYISQMDIDEPMLKLISAGLFDFIKRWYQISVKGIYEDQDLRNELLCDLLLIESNMISGGEDLLTQVISNINNLEIIFDCIEHNNINICKEAFEWLSRIFSVVVYLQARVLSKFSDEKASKAFDELYQTIRDYIELDILSKIINRLNNESDPGIIEIALRTLYWICMCGIEKSLMTEENFDGYNCLQTENHVNEFALKLDEIGGIEVIEKFMDHENLQIKENASIIMNNIYGKPNTVKMPLAIIRSDKPEDEFQDSPLVFEPIVEQEPNIFN